MEIMKQDRLGRVRTTQARRAAILEEFDHSGMSGQQFAKYHGLKYQTFATWVQKRRKRESAGEAAASVPVLRWVEAEVGESDSDQKQKAGSLVVELSQGAILRVGDEKEAKLAATLLGYLGVRQC